MNPTGLIMVALLLAGCTGDDAQVVAEGDPDAETTVVVQEFAFQEPSALLQPDTRVT